MVTVPDVAHFLMTGQPARSAELILRGVPPVEVVSARADALEGVLGPLVVGLVGVPVPHPFGQSYTPRVDAHLGLASKREARSFEEAVRRP